MIAIRIALALLSAAATQPAAAAQHEGAAPTSQDDRDRAEVDRATLLIKAGKPDEALAVLDPLIAAQEKSRKADPRQTYCARSIQETIFYAGMGAKEKKNTVVLPQSACYSMFLKGFALIDLKRHDEAKVWFERALAMAPSNSQFIGELGEWYKSRRDWDKAAALYAEAESASLLSPADSQVFDKTRALRGRAFVLVERGKLDEAEKLYRQCLTLDPEDTRSKQELQYIAEQRGKKI
jgi:tetratricopeptide (TPR) repeat protein